MSRVKLKLTSEFIVQHLLRLDPQIRLAGAHVTGRTLVLSLEMPDAPAGADEVEPVHVRASEQPDPIQLVGLRWKRKGQVVAVDRPAPAGQEER
jgi:hypothetical protein